MGIDEEIVWKKNCNFRQVQSGLYLFKHFLGVFYVAMLRLVKNQTNSAPLLIKSPHSVEVLMKIRLLKAVQAGRKEADTDGEEKRAD